VAGSELTINHTITRHKISKIKKKLVTNFWSRSY